MSYRYKMTRISLGIIYLFIGILNLGFSYTNAEISEINCKITGTRSKAEHVSQTTFISVDNFTSITDGDPPSSTKNMPTKPRDLLIKLASPFYNIAAISWYIPKEGYVRHFLLDIKEVSGSMVQHEYVLVTVRAVKQSEAKVACDYKLRNGSDKLASTVWAFGPIITTKNGHMTADVDEYSKSETVSVTTNKDYLQRRDVAQQCICSKLHLVTKAFPSSMSYKIRSDSLPSGTKIKIQLLKVIVAIQGDFEETSFTTTMNRNFDGNFRINTTGKYSIRVQRLCNTGYSVDCGKDQADGLRSEPILVISSDRPEQSTTHSNVHLPLQRTNKKFPKPMGVNLAHRQKQSTKSLNVVSQPMKEDVAEVKTIIQLAIIIFGFSLTTIIITAVIVKICSVLIRSRKKSSQYYKHPSCVTLNDTGHTMTKILTPRRVAIIFTKDTVEHVSRVYQLKSSLRRLGIDATPYDENVVPGMRLNWIQLGENIATESDVVLFIISPNLVKLCKRRDDSIESETDINLLNSVLHKLPVVVLNSLKVGELSSDKSKPRVISVFLSSQTTCSTKHLVSIMRREHPSIMIDDVELQYDEADNEINMKHIKRLENKIKS